MSPSVRTHCNIQRRFRNQARAPPKDDASERVNRMNADAKYWCSIQLTMFVVAAKNMMTMSGMKLAPEG
jgi:hypothetical protein